MGSKLQTKVDTTVKMFPGRWNRFTAVKEFGCGVLPREYLLLNETEEGHGKSLLKTVIMS